MKSRKALRGSAQLSFLHAIQSPRKVSPRPWPSPKLSLLASDEELAVLVQHGNDQAFDVLVGRYYKKLLQYAHRFLYHERDLDDIIQDVFLRVYQHMSSYEFCRPFRPWIYRIAHNAFISSLQKHRHDPIPVDDMDQTFASSATVERPDTVYLQHELADTMEHALSELPSCLRAPIILRYYDGLHYEDIATILHIPVATVGVRLHRGLKVLRAACRRQNVFLAVSFVMAESLGWLSQHIDVLGYSFT